MTYKGVGLSNPETLLEDIPGAPNHDGFMFAIGPDGLLYMATGDASEAALAQNLSSLADKVLRLNLDGTAAFDNPFGSLIFSYGHRNPQGPVFHPETRLPYITEHGPGDNDEVNIVEIGRNYGWPDVHGFCDNDVSGLNEETFCAENNVAEPIAAWTPTIAPSGADFYDSDLISAWNGSLLFTTLKFAALIRLQLFDDGTAVRAEEIHFQDEFGRLHDVLVGPETEVYLATSNRDGRAAPVANDDRGLVYWPE